MSTDAATHALVARLRAGDTDAFESLFDAHYPELFRSARRWLRDEAEAEDVVQEVFLRLWRDREALRVERSIRPLLYVSVRHRALDRVRRRRLEDRWFERLPEPLDNGDAPAGLAAHPLAPPNPAVTAELHDAVGQGLAALPERCRTTFLLCREEGLSYAEVARVMGVSPGTVKTQMTRALDSLRRTLAPFLAAPPDPEVTPAAR